MSSTLVKSALQFAIAIGQAVRESGPQGIPSGQLYAILMDKCDLSYYRAAVDFLIGQHLIRESNHILIWIGD